ncbi:hypothetical protein LCGC14_0939360 [marine sediment metagenome]|uniref:Major facilitator superfamily (MFS) profile domain-containing protein n=1 Tax=marine sediment metagenome TaxID=412755 RepID=A0A0F9R457_9ZZZZ
MSKIKSNFSFTELKKNIGSKSLIAIITVNTLISLFFIQGLRGFFSAIRIALFHVVFGEDVMANLLTLLGLIFLFLPGFTNTISKKIDKNRIMIFSIYAILIVRLLWAFHLTGNLEVVYSGLIIMFYGFYLSTFLTTWIEESGGIKANQKMIVAIFSFFSALLIDYLIRTIGFSQDISLISPGLIADWRITQYIWLVIQIPLTILCIYLTKIHLPRFSTKDNTSSQESGKENKLGTQYSLIFSGIGMFLFLLFNLFLYPNAIGQFTDTNYFFNNIINIISVMIAIYIVLFVKIEVISNKTIIIILNGFMILSLGLFFIIGNLLMYVASILISISLIIMYLNVYLLFSRLSKISFKWEKVKTISNGITIGFAFLILFTFLHAFTTEWAAILAMFKGLGSLIMILAGVIFSISTVCAVLLKTKEGVEE